ncbi:MAG TPA: hypothetical protein VFG83_06835 [Kofleriaceae bacterium]|nr:hypothetical protein [Kofleriaceae bacterium]
MKQLIVVALCALALFPGCGESQHPDSTGTSAAEPAEPAPEPVLTPEQAHQGNVVKACSAMCPRLTECAVADTRKNSPKTLENIDVDALTAAHTKKCEDQCTDAGLSHRQLQVIEDCMNAGGDCEAFVTCLEAAEADHAPAAPAPGN